MTTDIYELTTEMLEREITAGKNLILDQLYKDDIITARDYKNYSMNYCIIIRKPSFFSHLWKKSNDIRYTVVKQLSWSPNENNTKNEKRNSIKLEVIDMEKFKDKNNKGE